MDYRLEDLMDMEMLRVLLERLEAIYSFPTAILDKDAKILIAIAWQDICTKFHRINPETEKGCIKSDKYISDHLLEANPAVCYKCANGLIDCAFPIIIDGKHLGNFFIGQFFLEKPDLNYFRNQAKLFGFDERAYLEAVEKTPIWTKEKQNRYIDFIKEFIELIANIGLKRLKEIEAKNELKKANNDLTASRITAIQMLEKSIEAKKALEETNKKLFQEVEERIQAEEKIKATQILLQASIESQKDMIILSIDKNYRYLCYNSYHKQVMKAAYNQNINIGMNLLDCITNEEDRKKSKINYDKALNGKSHMTVEEYGDLERYYYETRYNPILNDKNEIIGATAFSANVTERRKAEKALCESEKKYRMIVETAIEGIITLNSDGRITFINQQMASLLKYTIQEMMGQKFELFIAEEQLGEHLAQMNIRRKGEDAVYERCLRNKDGERCWVIISARAIIDSDGKFEGSFGMLADITKRKQAEEALRDSESLYKAILNASPDDITISDMNGRILMVSPKALTMFGYQEEEILGRLITDFIIAEDRERAILRITLRSQGVVTGTAEYCGLRKDGTTFDIEVNSECIKDSDGKPSKIIFIVRDITDRKQAEVVLLENRQQLADIITFLPDATIAIDKNKHVIIWNKAMEEMTGVPASEMIGKGGYLYSVPFHGEPRPILLDFILNYNEDFETKYLKINREGDSFTTEVFCKTLYNNNGAWVFAKASPLHDRNGNIVGAIESIRDITERKLAEETLRESERRYTKAQQVGHIGSWEYNINSDTFWGSDEAKRIYGFNLTSDYFTTEEVLNCIIERERVNQALVDLIENNKPYDLEFEIRRYKSEERLIINSVAELIKDKNGYPLKVTGVIQDITKRKRAEAMFLDIIDKNPLSIQVVDKEGYTLRVNSAHTKLFGSVPPSDYSVLEDFQLKQQGFGELIERAKNGEVVHLPDLFFNAHILSVDLPDVPVWIRMVIFPINDNNGKPERFVLMHENITERKKAEEAMRESEALYRSILNASPDDITITDMEGRILLVSPIAMKMFGYKTEDEMIGHLISEFIYPEDWRRASTNLVLLFQGLKHSPDEYRGLRLDGSTFYMEVNGEFIRNADGQPTKMVFIVRDISERKQAEEELNKSKEKYRIVADFTYDWESWRAPDGTYVYISPSCERISGHTVQKFMSDPELVIKITHSDDRQNVFEHYHLDFNKEQTENVEIEYRIIKPDGSIRWISHWCTSIFNESGEWLGRRESNRDITDRKLAEIALVESQKQLADIITFFPDAIMAINKDNQIIIWNKAMEEMTQVPAAEMLGKGDLAHTIPFYGEIKPMLMDMVFSNQGDIISQYPKVKQEGDSFSAEVFCKALNNKRGAWVFAKVSPLHDSKGNIIGAIESIRDITERKQVEEKLYENEEKLRTLFGSMTEMVVLHELVFDENNEAINYRILDCNETFTKITGILKEEAIGNLATEVYKTGTPPYLEEYIRVSITKEPLEYSTYYKPMDKYFIISVVPTSKNCFATITTDITTIRQIQEVLSNKNKELENYLYVASHDLRSPLVNIQGFSQRLQKQTDLLKDVLTKCVLDAETKTSIDKITGEDISKTLNYIFSNVTKMDILISGLLQISRTGQIKLTINKTDMNKLFKTIISSLNYQINNIAAKVIVEDLVDCYGDENQLNQLFSNIIGNALKYRDKERELIITISSRTQFSKVIYIIKDTGIGIAARHLEKIWDVFYRVDSASSEAGEGIGLSLAKRIADKHRGKIWAESKEGEGSTFYVELQINKFSE